MLKIRHKTETLLTTTEVAKLWECSPRTVVRAITAGDLAAQRLPGGRGRYRIRYEDALAVIAPGALA